MLYIGRVRVSLLWFVPTIVIKESGEDTRVVFIRVCDTCDNAVLQQNQAIPINISDSLNFVFLSLDIERRSLVAAMLKPSNTSPDTEAVQIRYQLLLKPFNLVEADMIACNNDQHTCGASLMPDGHLLAKLVHWNETLTCATAIERTLFSCSASTISTPLVHFEKRLCSVCGIVNLSKQPRVEQGCKGDAPGKWTKRCQSPSLAR